MQSLCVSLALAIAVGGTCLITRRLQLGVGEVPTAEFCFVFWGVVIAQAFLVFIGFKLVGLRDAFSQAPLCALREAQMQLTDRVRLSPKQMPKPALSWPCTLTMS